MNNKFIQQTHFIGVLPPENLVQILEDCRGYMSSNYGCKSGYGTPIHITLIPPFSFETPQATKLIARCVSTAADTLLEKKQLPFSVNVEGFNAFGDRTIFANVLPSKQWTDLRDEIYGELKRNFPELGIKKDRRPFQPHLTVANRDIPPEASVEALEYFSTFDLKKIFSLDNICIFTKSDRRWILQPENIIHLS